MRWKISITQEYGVAGSRVNPSTPLMGILLEADHAQAAWDKAIEYVKDIPCTKIIDITRSDEDEMLVDLTKESDEEN